MPTNDYQTGAQGQTGVWSSLNGDSIRIDPEIDKELRDMSAREAPFTWLLDSIGSSKPSGQMTFQWLEEWPVQSDGVITTAAAGTTAATSIVVDNAELVLPGWVFRVLRTGENIKVVSRVVGTNTLTVVRAFGSPAKAVVAGDPILYLGHASEEGQNPPEMLMRGTDHGELQMQEILHAVGLSLWEVLSRKRGIGEMERIDRQGLNVFRRQREHFAIFGRPGKFTAASTMPIYQMAGLEYFCEQHNQINMGGGLSYDGIARASAHIFEYGDSQTRYGFTSFRQMMNIINLPEVKNNVVRKEESKKLGFEINQVSWPGGGTVDLVALPILNRRYVDDRIFITDLGDLRKRTHSGAEGLHIDRDIQTPGSRRKEWMMSDIIGLEHLNTLACGVLKNCG